jgi:Ni/Co efflux regulator RcnB
MKKLVIAFAAVIGLAAVVPMTAAQAETKKVIIKRGGHDHGWRHHDRGHHYGWRNRDRHHGGKKVVIIKKRGHRHDM